MRILLADDQVDAAVPLRDFLVDNGHHAELVDSAEAAIQKTARGEFDFILMDQYFPAPGMDGIEATRRILKARPGQRVMILTAYGDLNSSHQALATGAYRYIFAPCEQETILAVMMSAQAVVDLEEAFKSDSTLRKVMDRVGIGISVIDRSYRILYMNEHQRKISQPNALCGGICWMEFNQNVDAKSPCPWCPVKPAIQRGNTDVQVTSSMVDGRLRYYNVVASPIRSETGQILAAVEFVRDITDQYEADQKGLGAVNTDDRLLALLMRTCSLGYARARLYEFSEDETVLRGRVEFGDQSISIRDIELVLQEDCYSKNTIALGSPVIYHKGELGERLFQDRLNTGEVDQWIDIPLRADGKCFGKITVDNRRTVQPPGTNPEPRTITDADFPYLQLLGESAAREILRERQLRKMTDDSRRLSKLRELAQAVTNPETELHQDLQSIVESCVDLIGVQGVHLRLLQDSSLNLASGKGPYHEYANVARKSITASDTCSGSVQAWINHGEIIQSDAQADQDLQALINSLRDIQQQDMLRSIKSWACFPILFEGKLLGVLGLQSKKKGFFGPTTQNAVKDFVGMIGPILWIDRLLTDLKDAQQQLIAAARAAVHQVSNPNSATQVVVENWMRQHGNGKATPETAADAMRTISENTARIAKLSVRLQRFLKGPEIVRSAQAVELEPVILRAIRGHLPKDEGYCVTLRSEPRTPAVHVDPLVLAEIFGELALNARRAMTDARKFEVHLSCASRHEVILENLVEEEEYVRAEVRDSGPGVAPDKKTWIFEPFHKTSVIGTGLGLSTLRDTLKMMGGAIRETSKQGEGARFLLMIPVNPKERKEGN